MNHPFVQYGFIALLVVFACYYLYKLFRDSFGGKGGCGSGGCDTGCGS